MTDWDEHLKPHYPSYEKAARRIVAGIVIVPLVGAPLVALAIKLFGL